MDFVNGFISAFKKPEYNHEHTKMKLSIALNRLKLQRNKKTSLNTNMRREIATFLSQSKDDCAMSKAEGIIKEQHFILAHNLLELHIERVTIRADSIKTSQTPPPDLIEAIASILFAAPRVEIPELKELVQNWSLKWGQPFVQQCMTNANQLVTPQLVSELSLSQAPKKQIYELLKSCATQYNVKWDDSAMKMELGIFGEKTQEEQPSVNTTSRNNTQKTDILIGETSVQKRNPNNNAQKPTEIVGTGNSQDEDDLLGLDLPSVPTAKKNEHLPTLLPSPQPYQGNFPGVPSNIPGVSNTNNNNSPGIPNVPDVPDIPFPQFVQNNNEPEIPDVPPVFMSTQLDSSNSPSVNMSQITNQSNFQPQNSLYVQQQKQHFQPQNLQQTQQFQPQNLQQTQQFQPQNLQQTQQFQPQQNLQQKQNFQPQQAQQPQSNNYEIENDDFDLDLPSVPKFSDGKNNNTNNNSGGPGGFSSKQNDFLSSAPTKGNPANNYFDDDLDLPSVPSFDSSKTENNGDIDFDLPSVPLSHSSITAYSVKQQPAGKSDQKNSLTDDDLLARFNRLKD